MLTSADPCTFVQRHDRIGCCLRPCMESGLRIADGDRRTVWVTLKTDEAAGRLNREVAGRAGRVRTILELAGEPALGMGILPQATGLKNLFFASRLGLPGLGLEGEFASGAMAAGLGATKGRTPFSRSPLLKRA